MNNVSSGQPIASGGDLRFTSLDSIRFVCALWVMVAHFHSLLGYVPATGSRGETNPLIYLLAHVYLNLFNAQAAVIVFFVISGFCIHYPFRNSARVPLAPFFARRYLRIGIPFGLAMAIGLGLGIEGLLLHPDNFTLSETQVTLVDPVTGRRPPMILWSLVAELTYYTIYPVLFWLRRQLGWHRLLAASYVLAAGVILLNPRAKDFPAFGDSLTWVVGLPCWLLGCKLAEEVGAVSMAPVGRASIWIWRLGILVLSVIARVLNHHRLAVFPWTGLPWTLNLFAVACYFWLRNELAYGRSTPPPSALERAGKWSYSLYLMHLVGERLWHTLVRMPHLGGFGDWALKVGFTLCFSYLFYLVVEKPSHWLARRVAHHIKRPAE